MTIDIGLFLREKFDTDVPDLSAPLTPGTWDSQLINCPLFKRFLVATATHWKFVRSSRSGSARYYIKFDTPDSNTHDPKYIDSDATIYDEDDNYGVSIRKGNLIFINHTIGRPKDNQLLKTLAYLDFFQALSDGEKLAHLRGDVPVENILEAFELAQITKQLERQVQQNINAKLEENQYAVQQLLRQVDDLYQKRIQIQHQASATSELEFEIKSIRNLAQVKSIRIEGGYLFVNTHPLVVEYFDPSLYERYKHNYYDESTRRIMDLVMAGDIEMITSECTLRITLTGQRLSHSTDYHDRFEHPHQTCEGNFAGPLRTAANEFKIFDYVSIIIQWYKSLAFDDSTVARSWLISNTGFRIKGLETTRKIRYEDDRAFLLESLAAYKELKEAAANEN